MKTILFFTIILLFTFNLCAQQVLGVKIEKYENEQANTLILSTNYSKPFILSKKHLAELKGKTIYHVDLVYTQFKESVDFDQAGLNSQRILQLHELLPQLKSDKPTWSTFEQTGATDRKTAKGYFHGFVVHYGESIEFKDRASFFKPLQKEFSTIDIDNQIGGRVEYYTGSSIEMPALAVCNQDGDTVIGLYQLSYREFRNQAEIALSGIPMTYNENGKDEVFNSVGMYEIRASQNGEELVLTGDVLVNFQTTEVLDDVSFFEMNEDGHWGVQEPIVYDKIGLAQGAKYNFGLMLGKQVTISKYRPITDIDQGSFQGYSRIIDKTKIDEKQLFAALSKQSWNKFWHLFKEPGSKVKPMVQEVNQEQKSLLVFRDNSVEFLELVLGQKFDELTVVTKETGEVIYGLNGKAGEMGLTNILGDEPIPPSPGLISGLKTKGFGVFNCDQTRRIDEPLALSPTYYNIETGEKLEDLYVCSVIDLKMNSAFSFHPNHLVINGQRNVKLILFTRSMDIYIFDKSQFSQVPTDVVNVDLKLKKVTDQVKSTDDLQKILDI